MKNCNSCGSDQFKKATLVVEEGQSVTVGVGLGLGGGTVGVGVGRGITKSAIAEKCSPPKKKDAPPFGDAKLWQILAVCLPGIFAFVDGANFVGMDYFWLVWLIAGMAFLFSKGWGAEKESRAAHKQELAVYDRTYLCLRCGALSQPFDAQT